MNKKFFFFSVAALFMTMLFIKNSELTATCAKNGLETCFLTIIPSLFPFMVMSEILCECGCLELFGKLLGKPLSRIYKLSESTMMAVLSGLIFGFPVGTRAVISLYDKKEISADELNIALGFCGIPSFGFLVNVMGKSLFSNKGFGIFMYIVAIFSALISGLLFSQKKAITLTPLKVINGKQTASEILTAAISSAIRSIITLCSYVIFFSCVVGTVSSCVSSKLFGSLLGITLELSSGTLSSSQIGGITGVALCGVAVGWSGISVHCQTIALISDRTANFSYYFIQKLFQGIICGIFAVLYSLITDFAPPVADLSVFSQVFSPNYVAVTFIIFSICFFIYQKAMLTQKSPNAKH